MMTIENILASWTSYRQKQQTVQSKYPFYDWACKNVKGYKTLAGNVAFRKKCLTLAAENPDFAQQLWIMCSRDMLFYINTFGYTYDPRLVPKSTVVPFITYGYQDVTLDEIKESIELKFDELTEKSRDMGASWMYLTVYTWFWLFKPYCTFRLLSRTEDLVDKTDDPDCLFWKVDFTISHLPRFLCPNFSRIHLHLKNEDNSSTMEGVTTTSDSARGGRCTAMLLDEFAAVPDGDGMLKATRDVTKCRHFNSTHQGAGTAFYRLSQGKIRKLIIHWTLHPEKSKGLYYAKEGKLVRLDDFKGEVSVNGEKYQYPEQYPFRLDGKMRSPWYDGECDRASHPMEIAQELDIDPFSSDFQYFEGQMVQEIETEFVRPPFWEGELEFDEDSFEPIGLVAGKNGSLRLWINPDIYGGIPEDIEIGAAADISAGTGASNSVASFGNLKTGEKIAEYANPWIKPEAFARLVFALSKFFNNAFLVPDGGGPGRTFCDELINIGFRNLYYRRNEEGLNKRISDKPGVYLNPKEKAAVLGKYRRALKDKTFIQRSHEANQECLAYIFTTGNCIEHSASSNSIDPSGAGDNHGDRVIADALLNKCFELFNKIVSGKRQNEAEIPPNSPAGRRLAREAKEKAMAEW